MSQTITLTHEAATNLSHQLQTQFVKALKQYKLDLASIQKAQNTLLTKTESIKSTQNMSDVADNIENLTKQTIKARNAFNATKNTVIFNPPIPCLVSNQSQNESGTLTKIIDKQFHFKSLSSSGTITGDALRIIGQKGGDPKNPNEPKQLPPNDSSDTYFSVDYCE